MRLGASILDAQGHLCAFFHNRDDEYRVLLPFIKEGLEQGDRGFHIVDPVRREDHRRRLAHAGLDVAAAEADGRLEIRDWAQAHVREGRFDSEHMLALGAEAVEEARRRGFRQTRFVTHMEWALAGGVSTEHLAEYEANANQFVRRDSDPGICVYDLTRWGAQALVDVIRSHPQVIIGGIVQENPFFVPPDEFLRQLRGRQGQHQPGAPR